MQDTLLAFGFLCIGLILILWRMRFADGHVAERREDIENTKVFDEMMTRRLASRYALVGVALVTVATLTLIYQLAHTS